MAAPGHALQEKLPAPIHTHFIFHCPWAQETCQETVTAPLSPPHHPPASGGLFLHQESLDMASTRKSSTGAGGITGLLLPTELPTAPAIPYVIEMLPLVRPLPLRQAVIHQLVLVAPVQPCNKPQPRGVS